MTLLPRLRSATAQAHAALEHDLDLIARLCSPTQRRLAVTRFYGFHLAAERLLSPFLDEVAGLDFADRRRTAWLAEDLRRLGVDADTVAVPLLPSPQSAEQALGFFYVLEGSTLGGKVVGRAVEQAGADSLGLSFLNPYGPRTGERWRTLIDQLEAAAQADAAAGEAIVLGAVMGFQAARQALCETVPA